MRERDLRCLIVAVVALVAAGCAAKLTPQQAAVEEAFSACQAQGPSAKLETVQRDGKFSVVGRGGEAQRVHDCMVRYDQGERRDTRAVAPPAKEQPVKEQSPKEQPLMASRLPGTWRGTLTQPGRAAGGAELATPATVRFAVSGGSLRWTLATAGATSAVSADGTAVVVDGELRMTGMVRPAGRTPSADNARATVPVRYAGTVVGDRLEVTGVTGDQQVHVLSIRRVAE